MNLGVLGVKKINSGDGYQRPHSDCMCKICVVILKTSTSQLTVSWLAEWDGVMTIRFWRHLSLSLSPYPPSHPTLTTPPPPPPSGRPLTNTALLTWSHSRVKLLLLLRQIKQSYCEQFRLSIVFVCIKRGWRARYYFLVLTRAMPQFYFAATLARPQHETDGSVAASRDYAFPAQRESDWPFSKTWRRL
jgi:hypothetical protein